MGAILSKGDDRMFTNRLTRLFVSATSALLLILLLRPLPGVGLSHWDRQCVPDAASRDAV
jgi:hypothetical protein